MEFIIGMAISKPLSLKERKLLKAVIKESTLVKAGHDVSTHINDSNACATASNGIKSHNVQLRLQQLFDQLGMSETQLAQGFIEKTKTKKTLYFTDKGVVVDTKEVEDSPIQLKAMELISEFRGWKISKTANVNANFNINKDDISNFSNQEIEFMLKEIEEKLATLEEDLV